MIDPNYIDNENLSLLNELLRTENDLCNNLSNPGDWSQQGKAELADEYRAIEDRQVALIEIILGKMVSSNG